MSTVQEVAIAIAVILVVNLLLRITRWLARRPRTISWAWRNSLPRPLSTPRHDLSGGRSRKTREWVVRRAAEAVAWHAERPLRIQPFEGASDTDPAAVSSALSAAMTRIASLRRSGVDTVTAPIEAGSAMEAIAEGVKAAPAGGELAAALLRLGWWALARGELQLSGHVLASSAAGPGLALTIATASGRVLERVTIRAGEFEPDVGGAAGGLEQGNEADRLTRVATAAAVWTHFKILEDEWHLSKSDLQQKLRTSQWRSYALARVGIEGKDQRTLDATRALYAEAVDADTSNLVAQFNLASAELKDDLLAHVPPAAMSRLELVHRELARESRCDPHDVPNEQLLLNCDPLHYQVSYKLVAAKLNHDTALEAELETGGGRRLPSIPTALPWLFEEVEDSVPPEESDVESQEPQPDGHAPVDVEGFHLTLADLNEITSHLRDVESTLVVLLEADAARWMAAGSRPWEQLTILLSEIEGPMLVLWAMVALRVGPPTGELRSPEELWVYPSTAHAGSEADADHVPDSRRGLIERMEKGSLTPGRAVAFARGPEVSRTSRTRFNLACWYADIELLPDSIRQLELSLESGGDPARRRLYDKQLRRLSEVFESEWEKLQSRYAPTTEAAAAGGGEGGHRLGPVAIRQG